MEGVTIFKYLFLYDIFSHFPHFFFFFFLCLVFVKLHPPKTVPLPSFWLTSLSKNFFTSFSNTCSPHNPGESKRRGDWKRAGPCVAFQSIKAFLCPCFLFVRKRFQPPRPFLSSKGQIQLLIWRVRKCRKKQYTV